MAQKRRKSINYSHLPDADSIAHGDLYVAVNNVQIYKNLSEAHKRQTNKHNKLYHSMSEVFTVSINNVLLLDWKYDESHTYRKCLLPMPGWIYFPENTNNSSIITRAYGVVALKNHELRTKQIELEREEKTSCISRCLNSKHVKKIILHFREHPWLPNLIILIIQAAIEIIIFLDIILDLIVVIDLYSSPYKFTFTISCGILIAPYFIAWSALFQFVHRNDDGIVSKKYKCMTILFTFSPIGLFMILLNDIYHVIECVFLKPIYFIITCGRKLRSESFEELGYYKLRRVSEIFSESVLQACVQLYILLSLQRSIKEVEDGKGDHMELDAGIDINPISVISAFLSSLFIILLWITILYFESKKNGMPFVEYVTVVFQGSFKFIPSLPAIMRGKPNGKKVNWIYLKIRNGSVGTIAGALISPLCSLKIVKLSTYSIRSVSRTGCRYLGNVLRTSNVNLILSQKESQIKDLFALFDISKTGSFDFEEFSRVILVMRSFRAYSTNHKLLYARMGNKINETYYKLFDEYFESNINKNENLLNPIGSSDGISFDSDMDSVDYRSESDEKRDRYIMEDKKKDEQKEKLIDAKLDVMEDIMRNDRTWTDSVTNVSIYELIESYGMLADKHYHKIWLLDMLIKVRSSTTRLPCLDYDQPLYYAVKSNNICMVSLLMAYGYDKNNGQEFEHCVIESIVTQQYKMALVLCEQKGIPIVVRIRKGYNIINKYMKNDSMNQTRTRSGLSLYDNVSYNPFVTVSLFEQTAQTDIIYNSNGSPLWNHYLLFIIPFECIDDYIYFKRLYGNSNQFNSNPLTPKNNESNQKNINKIKIKKGKNNMNIKYHRSDSFSVESIGLNRNISIKTQKSNNIFLPEQLQIGNLLSTEVNISPHSVHRKVSPNFLDMPISRSRDASRDYLRMSVCSTGTLMDNGCIDSTDIFSNNMFFNTNSKRFIIKFKIYHHEYNSKQYELNSKKKIKKDKKDIENNNTLDDIMLGYTNQNLFNYEELIDAQKKESNIKYTSNKLYGHHKNSKSGNYTMPLKTIKSVPMDENEEEEDADNEEDSDDEKIEQFILMDNRICSTHNSYEKYFTTILNLRKRPLKGKRLHCAFMDCKIDLSALKCYEEFGLDYINKNKNDLNGLFDTSKYDEIKKDANRYEDYLLTNLNSEEDNDYDNERKKNKTTKKKKHPKNTSRKFENFASV